MTGLSWTRVLAVLIKEFKQLTRDRLTYAMMLAIPVVQLTLFGYAINTEPRHLPTAVLSQEDSRYARAITAALKNSLYFDFVGEVRSPADLDLMIRRGDAQFAVTIPGDFSRRVALGDKPQVLVEADATDPSATGGAVAALAALPDQALAHDLKGALAARGQASAPFDVVVHRRYNPEAITSYNIVPGLLGIILSLTLVMMTALSVTRETERGTMETLLSTPLEPIEVMVGKLAPYVMVGLIQTAIILVMAAVLFHVPMAGGWLGMTVGVGLFITGSLALGFLISTVARSQLQAMQMSFFYILPSILLSGFMFPFRGMPAWAQWIGEAIPVTHFLRVVRGSLLKGQGPGDQWRELLALLAFVCAVTALAMARYRRTLD
ncbi:MAG: ABC transporter permease subunit [Phenylobacterium sp.]|uniref:ABC transporter permease n=1 Tax=Phenylobacterium sp. TaxID=1871053 RepID=UPI0025D0327B|nr:ABC transporter permease [Phenylobacterium sp.]MBI1199060.1 ABC transporter permease subunit [Phenylobacterium sp.]